MIDKVLINTRFIEAVNFILVHKKVRKGNISDAINISSSKFSEILNGRMSIGIEDLANFCDEYQISSNFILTGKGEMLLSGANNTQAVAEPSENYSHSLQDVIQLQKEMIEVQKDLIAELKLKLGKEKAARGRTG